MFRYFEARMQNLMFTNTSILRRIRRHLFKDVRSERELRAATPAELKADESKGDVDLLFKDFKNMLKAFRRLKGDIADDEKKMAVIEGADLKRLAPVEQKFAQVREELDKMTGRIINIIDGTEETKRISDDFVEVHNIFKKIIALEKQALQGEYYALNREAAEKRGLSQTLVWTESEIRTAADKLWDARGETRKTKKEDKSVFTEESRIEQMILQVEKDAAGKNPETSKSVIAHLQKAMKRYREEMAQLYEKYRTELGDFSIIIKILVNLMFRIEDEEHSIFEEMEKTLVETGFPPKGDTGLNAIRELWKTESDEMKRMEAGVATVMRRMARVILGETPSL